MDLKVISEKELLSQFRADEPDKFYQFISSFEKYVAPIMRAKGYRRINESERTVAFLFGEVTFSRSRWTNGKRTRIPVDEKLGLKKHVRYAPELLFRISKLATFLPYRQVCKIIEMDYSIVISKDTVLKVVKLANKLLKAKERYRYLKDDNTVQKIKSNRIYVEGDGVMVKCNSGGDERKNMDLAHFVVHTGRKRVGPNRYELQNKKEIINSSHAKAKEELLDYLYNYFEITPDTVLISNSDNGKGYTCRIFIELKKALNIRRHEHFWDAYHLNEKIKSFFKPYPKDLQDVCFKAIQTHDKELLKTVFDTCEGLITDEEEMNQLLFFKQKLFRNFRYTKPATLRGLSDVNIGIMESQHRKITYRMKHHGMYWSEKGANTLSQMILLERKDELEELFFGRWKQEYEQYKSVVMSAGKLKTRSWQNPFTKTHGIAGHLMQRCEYKKASKNPYF